jgi:hypothetical protein
MILEIYLDTNSIFYVYMVTTTNSLVVDHHVMMCISHQKMVKMYVFLLHR